MVDQGLQVGFGDGVEPRAWDQGEVPEGKIKTNLSSV
jgi:hypothetical protein